MVKLMISKGPMTPVALRNVLQAYVEGNGDNTIFVKNYFKEDQGRTQEVLIFFSAWANSLGPI